MEVSSHFPAAPLAKMLVGLLPMKQGVREGRNAFGTVGKPILKWPLCYDLETQNWKFMSFLLDISRPRVPILLSISTIYRSTDIFSV